MFELFELYAASDRIDEKRLARKCDLEWLHEEYGHSHGPDHGHQPLCDEGTAPVECDHGCVEGNDDGGGEKDYADEQPVDVDERGRQHHWMSFSALL